MASKLEQALTLAMNGNYLFPLEENSKTPEPGYNWRARSTVDMDTIKGWFKPSRMGWPRNPNIGIDCGKSGWYVVDVDLKDGKRGDKTFAALDKAHGFTPTLEVVTPTGGRHLFYKNTAKLRNTAGEHGLGKDIDTRGIGGYVVAPGSEIDGQKYRLINKEKIADLDPWIAETLKEYRYKSVDEKGETISEDEPGSIQRAKAWLLDVAEHAYEGDGGDHITYATAAQLREFGCSEETAVELMLENWNDECEPPWDADDLERKVHNAFRYGQKATGAASAEAEFDNDESPSLKKQKQELAVRQPTLLETFDVNRLPKREWIYGDECLARTVSALAAPGGTGKSIYVLTAAIAKATGINLLGAETHGRAPVWVYNNEDDRMEMQRRIGAIMQALDVKQEDLLDDEGRGYLYVDSGEEQPFRIAKRGDHNEIKPLDVKWAIKHIKEKGIRLLIVDPFVSTHPAKENDNDEMEIVAGMYRRIAQETDCSVWLIHHTKKRDDASSDGHEGNLDTLRGASALGGVVRNASTLFNMSKKRAEEFGISDENRWRYVGRMVAKANMSAAKNDIQWFEKSGERIGVNDIDDEGEEIGVLRPVALARNKADALRDNSRELVYDIESACEGSTMMVNELAELLVENYPMQQNKRPKSLEKAILRLFEHGEASFRGKSSHLRMVQVASKKPRGPRTIAAIRCISIITASTAEEEALMS